MERRENETFEAYKARRAASNQVSKNLNRAANAGGKSTSREIQRDTKRKAGGGKIRGTYGRNLMAHFDRKNVNIDRNQLVHEAHLLKIAARKEARQQAHRQNNPLPLAA
jgi:hypothetical protein